MGPREWLLIVVVHVGSDVRFRASKPLRLYAAGATGHFRRILAAGENHAPAEQERRGAVNLARDTGDSWAVIGAALDTTRQAAQQRFCADGQHAAEVRQPRSRQSGVAALTAL